MIVCFFFNDTATTEIYTLSLHDALPISLARGHAHRQPFGHRGRHRDGAELARPGRIAAALRHRCAEAEVDRKSTRLNSSHVEISYAVFCLKKKKKKKKTKKTITS